MPNEHSRYQRHLEPGHLLEKPEIEQITASITGSGIYEKGESVDALFSWNYSGPILSQEFDGVALDDSVRSMKVDGIAEDRTFVLKFSGEDNVDRQRTVFVSFENRRYFGVSPLSSLERSDVLNLNSELASSHSKSVNYDCSGGAYFWYCFPADFGELDSTKVNGFPWNDWVLTTINFENQFGYSELYHCYRSSNVLNGTDIPVVWD